MMRFSSSPVLLIFCRSLARLIQLFGLYVVFHGHYSPGGGFQGGALLAAGIILLRMTEPPEKSGSVFPSALGTPLAAMGAFAYAGIGLLAMGLGGSFLDYDFVSFPGWEGAYNRSFNILIIEIGVALTVMAALVSIFDDLATGPGGLARKQSTTPEEGTE